MNIKTQVLVFLILLSNIAFAQVDPKFETGLSDLENGNYDTAKTAFLELLKNNPDSESILYNLGLTEFKAGHLGSAIGYWRKAQYLNPDLPDLERSLEKAFSQLKVKELPHKVSLFERLREKLLVHISWHQVLALNFIVLMITMWFLLSYFQDKRLAFEQEVSSPQFPSRNWALIILSVISVLILGSKSYEYTQPRAVVVVEQVSARTGPDESMSSVFELFEGLTVIMQQSRNGWIQVTYPGGRTGWVPESTLFQISGRDNG